MAVDFSVFHDSAPYRHFKPEDWKILEALFVERRLPAGEMLFHEGDPSDGLYWVRSGRLRVFRKVSPAHDPKQKQEQLLALLGAGQMIGEMSLVEEAPRSADVAAQEESVLYHLSKEGYEKLKREHPRTALRIQDLLVVTLSLRLREALRSLEMIRFWLL